MQKASARACQWHRSCRMLTRMYKKCSFFSWLATVQSPCCRWRKGTGWEFEKSSRKRDCVPTAAKELKIEGALWRGAWNKGRKNDCNVDVYRKMRVGELEEPLYLKKDWEHSELIGGCQGLGLGWQQDKWQSRGMTGRSLQRRGWKVPHKEKEAKSLCTCNKLIWLKYIILKLLCHFFYKLCP